MSASPPVGLALYFIDVLACLLFCLTLALASARFGREHTVPLDLPELPRGARTGAQVTGPSITLRRSASGTEIFLGERRVGLAELEASLRGAPPPSVTVRSEGSDLARVIGIAHAAGVRDIQLAYQSAAGSGAATRGANGRSP